jgi:hypothetical protein
MNDTTDEELFQLYSNPSKATTTGKKSSVERVAVKPASTSKNSKQRLGPSTLFEDLAANPIKKPADFNFVVPSFSPVPLIRLKKTPGSISEGNTRKRIKVVSAVGKFSNYESRERLIREGRKEKEELTSFPSTSEFWQWVKLSLSKDNYSKYIRAIKKFKANQDTGELAEEVGACFKVHFLPQCLQGITKKNFFKVLTFEFQNIAGMSLFLTTKQLEEVRNKLAIPI